MMWCNENFTSKNIDIHFDTRRIHCFFNGKLTMIIDTLAQHQKSLKMRPCVINSELPLFFPQ